MVMVTVKQAKEIILTARQRLGHECKWLYGYYNILRNHNDDLALQPIIPSICNIHLRALLNNIILDMKQHNGVITKAAESLIQRSAKPKLKPNGKKKSKRTPNRRIKSRTNTISKKKTKIKPKKKTEMRQKKKPKQTKSKHNKQIGRTNCISNYGGPSDYNSTTHKYNANHIRNSEICNSNNDGSTNYTEPEVGISEYNYKTAAKGMEQRLDVLQQQIKKNDQLFLQGVRDIIAGIKSRSVAESFVSDSYLNSVCHYVSRVLTSLEKEVEEGNHEQEIHCENIPPAVDDNVEHNDDDDDDLVILAGSENKNNQSGWDNDQIKKAIEASKHSYFLEQMDQYKQLEPKSQ